MENKSINLNRINKELGTNYRTVDDINWYYVSKYPNLPEEFIDKHKNLVYWDCISKYQKLSEEFIEKHKNLVNWLCISMNQKLSEKFIDDHKDLVDWYCISEYQKLSEEFIDEHKNLVDWDCISVYQKLSEEFIEKYKDLVNWSCISECQKLSEEFIEKHKNLVNWKYISIYQKLSEKFIEDHKYIVNWLCIFEYQKLSEKFIEKHGDLICLNLIKCNWNYKDKEFLKEQVVSTGLYECHDDYFIAYKGVRLDRYSNYNFQYQYLPNETYESFCDCSCNENSFGLSVWTKENATRYCDELVIKVKVNYEDVGRVVHNGGKIRCRKLTVLN